MRFRSTASFIILTVVLLSSCSRNEETIVSNENLDDAAFYSGGGTTVFNDGSSAFENPSSNCNAQEFSLHAEGDVLFEATFVTAPSIVNSGLGPVFNQNSCATCHPRNGSSPAPVTGNDLQGLLFRLSEPGTDAHGGPKPLTGFGGQLQTKSIFNIQPEGKVNLNFATQVLSFLDGNTYELQKPLYSFYDTYTPLPSSYSYSPRIAPRVIGLGLLEAVSDQTILMYEDENDNNGDGISGKANIVWNEVTQQMELGRFGWKATEPTLYQQSAKAYLGDMGITSPYFLNENSFGQPQLDTLQDDPEVSDDIVRKTAFYTQSLAVPARRNIYSADVVLGENIFSAAKCNSCHRPSMVTGILTDVPSASNQQIFPYTDLLLHDMGPDLADNFSAFNATGTEWRTPPLWGMGLTHLINGHTNFLHDGRARNIMEAILWHGGEAEQSRNYVKALSATDRARLIKFLESL